MRNEVIYLLGALTTVLWAGRGRGMNVGSSGTLPLPGPYMRPPCTPSGLHTWEKRLPLLLAARRREGYPWDQANYYCSRLGPGWQGISIESVYEDQFVSDVVGRDHVKYIWTGGFFIEYRWRWPSGGHFYGLNWSYTGGLRKNQPDNREDGKEFCLAVLNNFYQDGIKWHDVACHHEKPIICERDPAEVAATTKIDTTTELRHF